MPRRYARRRPAATRWSGRKYIKPSGVSMARTGLRRSMISGRIKQPVQYFKRTLWLPDWLVTAGTTDNFASLKFNLSQLPQYTEFTQLYDQYQIKGVRVELIPQFDSANMASTSSTNIINQNYSVLDYDDVGIPTSMDTIMQYQNVRRCPSTKVMKRFLKPKVATQVYSTALTTNYSSKRNVWLDCNQPDTEHYGMKFGFTKSSNAQKYSLRVIYYLAFKNVR